MRVVGRSADGRAQRTSAPDPLGQTVLPFYGAIEKWDVDVALRAHERDGGGAEQPPKRWAEAARRTTRGPEQIRQLG